jgi:hypothetical protein
MIHKEIKERNLPVDILVCSNTFESDDHLVVLKPACEIAMPHDFNGYLRIPDILELHNLFHEKEYDRIVCSTEGVMGLAALYLKHAYSVPAFFHVHADWVMFCRKTLNFSKHNQNRVRRFLRTYYGAFDKVFTLNNDRKKGFTEHGMDFDNTGLTMQYIMETIGLNKP